MRGFLPVAALRFREALAGRMLWLLPLHFAITFALVRGLPGPSPEARLQAADATALGLAAVLALVAAAVMGASPLADERLRPRGALLLASPVGPTVRVLGTALGTGTALALLVLGLCASAMAAVDLGVGGGAEPVARLRPTERFGMERTASRQDPDELLWEDTAGIGLRFPRALRKGEILVVHCRARRADGAPTGARKGAEFFFAESRSVPGSETLKTNTPMTEPFRVTVPVPCRSIIFGGTEKGVVLGLRFQDVWIEEGPRPRSLARGLHAAALFGGLLAVMGAALALSAVTGTGVAAGGAISLAALTLFQPLFADAASTLAHAGAMAKAMQATLHEGQEAVAQTGTPPALAPVFTALANVLPDGTRFDLAASIAANEVPWSGDVVRAVGLGLGIAAGFLAVAALAARRRP